MTRGEMAGVMAIIETAYPQYYKNTTPEQKTAAVNLWLDCFAEEDVNAVAMAVKAFIRSDEKGFPPVPGQIRAKLSLIAQPGDMGEIEAWGHVRNALKDGFYGAREAFDKLPKIVQSVIGNSDRLREWSQLDAHEVETVIQSHFVRGFRAKLATVKDYQSFPAEGKREFIRINGKTEMKQLPE